MGQLSASLSASLGLLASGIPHLPTRMPVWMLIVPCGVAGVVTVGVCSAHLPMQALAMFAIGVSMVLVAHHTAWLAVPALIVEFALGGYEVPGVGTSMRVLATLVAALVALAMLARSRPISTLDTPARWVVIPSVAFFFISTVINLLFSELDYVTKYFRYQIGLGITLALVLVFVRDRRAIMVLATAALGLAVVSSIVALGQRIGGPFALYTISDVEAITSFGTRAFGLTGSPVALANNLVSVVVPLLGFLAVTWSSKTRAPLALLLVTLLLLVGVYLTTTRSAILSIAAAVVVIMAAVDAPRRFALAGVGVVGALLLVAAIVFGAVDERFLEGAADDDSAAGHVAIGQVALAVALDHAVLGIGREHFGQVSRAYVSAVSLGGGAQRSGQASVGTIEPHNDFLTVWCSWGIFGLLAYLGILVGTLRNYLVASRSADPFVRGLAVGCGAGMVAYLIYSSLHNALDASVILWYYAGLSATLASVPERAVARIVALRRRPPHWSSGRRAAMTAVKA